MFVAHLPAGIIVSNLFCRFSSSKNIQSKTKILLLAGLIGSILPDLDLLYFYWVDNRQNPHHSYLTHIPFMWLMTFLFFSLILKSKHLPLAQSCNVIFHLNILVHLVLDTIAGGIKWLFPLSDKMFYLVTIEPKYDWWVWNFILHWTFVLEIIIVVFAIRILATHKTSLVVITNEQRDQYKQ